MATTLTRVLFGKNRDITLAKFNIGSMTKAVTFDLEEFGVKGVQGLVIKGADAQALVKKHGASGGADNLYVQAGTAKGHLVFLIRDKTKPAFEAASTLVKDYDKVRAKLAAGTGKVVDVQPDGEDDATINKAAFAHADRLGGAKVVGGTPDLKGITGDVVLCAHGTPKVLPGKVIGSKLGQKTPAEIVDLLIGHSDPSKRLAKDYRGKITLAGCYTASGGPEADKQDDVFAKQVHDLLVAKGYKTASVVGMPGPTWTATGNKLKDAHGTTLKRGQEGVYPTMSDTKHAVTALRQQIDKLTEGVIAAAEKSPEQEKFYATPGAKAALDKIQALEKEMAEVAARVDTNTRRDIAQLTGTFGLRQIKTKFKGKLFGR